MNQNAVTSLQIESASHCPSGVAPRWTWWIKGWLGQPRYDVIGTNEHGAGLYLFRANGDHAPIREELLAPQGFHIPGDVSQTEALHYLRDQLAQLPHVLSAACV